MVEFDADTLRRRMKAISSQLSKAQKLRDKWQAEVVRLEARKEAFQVVLDDLGIAVDLRATSRNGSTVQLVTALLEDWPRERQISVRELKEESAQLREMTTNSISRVLIDMVEEGALEIVEKGAGRRQSTYRLAPQPGEDELGLT